MRTWKKSFSCSDISIKSARLFILVCRLVLPGWFVQRLSAGLAGSGLAGLLRGFNRGTDERERKSDGEELG